MPCVLVDHAAEHLDSGGTPDLISGNYLHPNTEGGELTTKFRDYEKHRILYYVVWDPMKFLTETPLQCFRWVEGNYVPCEPWFPVLQLGVTAWAGEYDRMTQTWLRWCDQQGNVLPSGAEGIRQAHSQATRDHRPS